MTSSMGSWRGARNVATRGARGSRSSVYWINARRTPWGRQKTFHQQFPRTRGARGSGAWKIPLAPARVRPAALPAGWRLHKDVRATHERLPWNVPRVCCKDPAKGMLHPREQFTQQTPCCAETRQPTRFGLVPRNMIESTQSRKADAA